MGMGNKPDSSTALSSSDSEEIVGTSTPEAREGRADCSFRASPSSLAGSGHDGSGQVAMTYGGGGA
jgi:hypothetical protein